MKCQYACQSGDHSLNRRALLAGLASGATACAAGLGGALASTPEVATTLRGNQKRILNIFLHGGVSQLETWDPKPNTDTGGPFRAIATSVPGIHISELLPYTAKQMHRLALVRSLNTKNNDHGKGQTEMVTGRNRMLGTDYPHLGAVAAKSLMPEGRFPLPGHILIRGAGSGSGSAAYLGPKYASVVMDDGKPPKYTERPASLSVEADARRNAFRAAVSDRFTNQV